MVEWLFVAAVLILLAAMALYAAPHTVEYTVLTPKAKRDEVIAFLSDTHGKSFARREERFIAIAKKLKPDVLVLGGDITDEKTDAQYLPMFLGAIEDIAPLCVYASGNHEMNTPKNFERMCETYKKFGVHVLRGDLVQTGNIRIYGIDSPCAKSRIGKSEAEVEQTRAEIAALGEIDKAYINILIAHRPEFTKVYEKSGFDLVLSGHAHGGQVRIPFVLNGLFAPNQGVFPRFAGGRYDYGALTHIVGRGLSFRLLRPRVFNRGEVVKIRITR